MRIFLIVSILILLISGCSLFATRPSLEMTYADSALRAAQEVKADILAPNLYREAYENYLKAKKYYKSKHFDNARKFALLTKKLAEEAEFISIKKGGATPDGPTDIPQAGPQTK